MIQVNRVIDYLRPLLTGYKVGGAADLASAKDDSRLMVENGQVTPALFVVLGKFQATTLSNSAILADYDERLQLIVCFNNQADRTGQAAQQGVYYTRLALLKLLFNYQLEPDCYTLQYVGDGMVDMDRARYWHQFEFKQLGRIDAADGVQLNLSIFNEMIANWNSNDPLADNPIATDILQPLY